MTHIIGERDFLDGVCRRVHEDDDGHQWVEGYDGERVYGIWMLPADEPAIIELGHRAPGGS